MPKSLPPEDRERILYKLRRVLEGEEGVRLAVVHGGFISSRIFRDIDVAVLLAIPEENRLDYVEELREKMERETGIAVDIQVLNNAPPKFAYKALSNCRILVERNPGLAASLRLRLMDDAAKLSRARPRTRGKVL